MEQAEHALAPIYSVVGNSDQVLHHEKTDADTISNTSMCLICGTHVEDYRH